MTNYESDEEKLIKSLSPEDLTSNNEIISSVYDAIEEAPGQYDCDRTLYVLKNLLSKNHKFYYSLFIFDHYWNSGGMQRWMLEEPHEQNIEFLKVTIEAFKFFGDSKNAKLIELLLPKSSVWFKKIEALQSEDKPEEDFDKVYEEIDKYDKEFTPILFEESPTLINIHKDILENPKKYIIQAKKLEQTD